MNSLNNFKVDWSKIGTFAIGISKIDKIKNVSFGYINTYIKLIKELE
jgi:hypothetical protein